MRALLLPLWLTALVFALSSGCASTPRSSTLAVTLANLKPQEATAFETRLAVTVRYTNESPVAFSLRGSSHKLTLNGRALGSAVSGEPLEIPGLTSVSQELTLNLSNFALLSLARDLQRAPTAAYEIDSTLFPASRLSRTLRVTKSGRLDLSDFAGPN